MFFHVVLIVATFGITITGNKMIAIFKKKLPNGGIMVIGEKPYFKENYIRYYSKEMEDGTIELWGYPTTSKYWGEVHPSPSCSEPVYLGTIRNGQLKKPDDFYSLAMPIQRSALKLYKKIGVYK